MDAHVTEPTARNALIGVLAVWFLLPVVSTGIALATALRINLSGSLPIGLQRLTAARIERGAFVTVCPDRMSAAIWPQAGAVTGGASLLKRVLALPGDQVVVQENGIQVNGQKIERSARLVADRAGRPMPRPAGGTVPAGQVWVLGDALASFDLRYFGPVSILGAAAPLLTRQR